MCKVIDYRFLISLNLFICKFSTVHNNEVRTYGYIHENVNLYAVNNEKCCVNVLFLLFLRLSFDGMLIGFLLY